VALAKVGSATSVYLDWKYLNGTRTMPVAGVPSAELTFTMPLTLGQYEFRFFANNGYTLLAVSPPVLVGPGTD
jgi:predicted NAD/FAD-binding protein